MSVKIDSEPSYLKTSPGVQSDVEGSHWVDRILKNALGIFRFPSRETNSALANLLWLVKLRWMAISLFFILMIPAVVSGYLDRQQIFIYLGVLASVFLFNFFVHLVWSDRKKPISSLIICFHLAIDLGVLFVLLSVTGGFENPFILLFLLHACLGGIIIPGRLSWPFLILIHTLLGILQFSYFLQHQFELSISFYMTVLAYHIAVFACWVVMRSLGAYLEQQHKRQAQSRVVAEKQDRLRAVGALAAGFSHEFASPLNAAKIRLERAFRTQPTEDITEALEAIKACEEVIHQMNSSQLDARDFKSKKINIFELLSDVVDSWKEQHAKAFVVIESSAEVYGVLPPITFAQVILNLLDNAEEAAPMKKITIKLDLLEDSYRLSIQDEGAGFAESVLNKLGEPFVTTKAHGTGLGLYVSQLFAQSLGGDLTIRNLDPKGTGSLITIRWPFIREDHA